MNVTFYDVGDCGGCPRAEGDPACFSLTFTKIGRCEECKHQGNRARCSTCERDERLLRRRDLYDEDGGECGGCQRDLKLLTRTDRFEKGLPDVLQQTLDRVDAEVGRTSHKDAIQAWLKED